MTYRHDLRLVRMNLFDGTLHCRAHGLLSGDEASDVLRRTGMSAADVQATDERASAWLKRFWALVGAFSRPQCEPVS